jgi:hypothetical protein
VRVVVVVVSVEAAQPARKIVARPRKVKATRFIFIVHKKRAGTKTRMHVHLSRDVILLASPVAKKQPGSAASAI